MEPTTNNQYQKAFFIIILILAIAIGNALAGWFIATAICKWRNSDRYVSFKGVAELQVKADLAIWDIGYKITGDDLAKLTAESLKNQKIITDFLSQNNFALNEIEIKRVEVIDQYAREYSSTKPLQRYILIGGVVLRTPKIDLVRQVSQSSYVLIQQGIVLMNKDESLPNPRYFFTKIDETRPQMLERATRSASLVAKQFAANAGCQIGSIRRASQGVFQILSIDSNAGQSYGDENAQIASINKIIRIVISVDYTIKT